MVYCNLIFQMKFCYSVYSSMSIKALLACYKGKKLLQVCVLTCLCAWVLEMHLLNTNCTIVVLIVVVPRLMA